LIIAKYIAVQQSRKFRQGGWHAASRPVPDQQRIHEVQRHGLATTTVTLLIFPQVMTIAFPVRPESVEGHVRVGTGLRQGDVMICGNINGSLSQ
jgi:hypothetical protein